MTSSFEQLEAAIASGKQMAVSNPKVWPELIVRETDDETKLPNLLEGANNIIAEIARDAAQGIQFPASTAYAHGLGILASAMTRSFRVKHMRVVDDIVSSSKPKPCNLYVLTAQPPSTGKGGINDAFQDPVWAAFETLNKKRAKELREVNEKIEALKAEKKACENPQRAASISASLQELFEEAKELGPIKYTFDDATPEAIDAVSAKQGGFWTVTSTEGQSIMSLVGGSYVAAGKDANANVLLKSWVMERTSTARISREGNDGVTYASIAIIAQEGSLDVLMDAAKRGVGIPDRFLMYDEPNMFGRRDHSKGEYHMRPDLEVAYRKMIHEVVLGGAMLIIGSEFDAIVGEFLNSMEPHLADGGRLGHPTVRGFYGKARIHITKLACVLHVAKEWAPGGSKSQDISSSTIREAIAMFKRFGFIYRQIVDASGASGAKTEREILIKALSGLVERKKRNFFKNEEVRQLLKNNSAFKTRAKINQYLRENCFPELQMDGYIYQVEAGIYVNPLICK